MCLVSFLLAAGSLLPWALAVPLDSAKRLDTYHTYYGKAEVNNWPSQNQWWHSFDAMFRANMNAMRGSCSQFNVPNNSEEEIADIYRGIQEVSQDTNVDARFILAVMIQESSACVRAPTTNYGVRNPGLMQSHNGAGTCNEGYVQTPCPAQTITAMIRDGAAGTPSGDGLVQLLQKATGPAQTRYFQAARMYNSGSIDASGDLEKGIADACYASNIANRLIGWVTARKTCQNNGIPEAGEAPLAMGEDSAPEPDFMENPGMEGSRIQQVQPAPQPIPQPAPVLAANTVVKAPASSVQPGSQRIKATSNMMAPGVTSNCARYYRVQDGDFCLRVAKKFNISFAELRRLNSAIDEACSNLWKSYDYCVEAL